MSRLRTADVVTADGVQVRVGRWDAPDPRGHCLLLQGRGDLLERYDGLARRLAAAGLTVVSVDWRGQGRSARLGAAPGVSHVRSFDDYLLDLDALLRRSRDLVGPRTLVAHSMGATVALAHLRRDPTGVARAAMMSPMWGFTGAVPTPLVRALAVVAVALGRSTRLAAGERPAAPGTAGDASMATDDPAGLDELRRLRAAHADAVVEGSTWGWTAAATAAMARLDRADLSVVRTDVLVASGRRDATVDLAAHARVAGRLPAARVVAYDAGHDLLAAAPAVTARVVDDLVGHLAGGPGAADASRRDRP